MDTQTVSKSKALLAHIWLFVQGVAVGGVFYVILAFLAVLIEKILWQRDELCRLEAMRLYPYPPIEPCVPDWIYLLLAAISLGPGTVFGFLFWPNVSKTLVQVISGLMSSGLAGIAFTVTGRKWGIVIFFVFYVFTTAFLTFIFLVMVFTG